MAVIETKYSIGDKVFFATTETTRKQHPCPDCKGERKWKAVSPAGSEYSFACPRCTARYQSNRDLSLDYTAHVPCTRQLTIGSVRTDTHCGTWGDGERNTYMCHETGVGSGSVYRESDLFPTEADAYAAAQAKADKANAEVEWIVKLYDKTLEISDYQLEHAMMKEAKDYQSKIGSLFWNVSDLFETIAGADDKDAILEAIDEYKNYTWERDKARFAEAGVSPQTERGL